MTDFSFVEDGGWQCACGEKLKPKKVNVEYLNSVFTVELLACDKCGLVLIPETLALGKMLAVEQLLEDK